MTLLARLDGVGRVEDVFELLEGTTVSLDGAEVPYESLHTIPADEDEDVLEADALWPKCNGCGVFSDGNSQRR